MLLRKQEAARFELQKGPISPHHPPTEQFRSN